MPVTPLQSILAQYRATSQTEREKGSYLEEFIRTQCTEEFSAIQCKCYDEHSRILIRRYIGFFTASERK